MRLPSTGARAIVAAICACVAAAHAAETPEPAEATARPVFHSSLAVATEESFKDGTLMLVVFGARWSSVCEELEQQALASPRFEKQAGALHVVRVDVDADERQARTFRVNAVPELVLMTAEQKIVARARGFMTAEELTTWVESGRRRDAMGLWEGTAPDEASDEAVPTGADPEDVARATKMLGEADPAARARVIAALASRRERAMPVMLAGLDDPYLGVRIGASELLRKLAPDGPAADPWAPRETREKEAANVRRWWAETGRLPPETEPGSTDPQRARFIESAIEDVFSGEPVRRTEGMSTLVLIGDVALPEVRAAISRGAASGDQKVIRVLEDVRWAILIPDVIEMQAHARRDLARGTSEQRQAAVSRLGTTKGALPALRELIDDPDPLIKESTVHALKTVGGAAALDATAILLKAKDTNLRMVAAQALGQSKNKNAGKYLAAAVTDPDEVVATVAIAALEEIKATDQQATLVKCLSDERWRVRAAAAEALGELEIKSAVPALNKLLADTDAFVVKSAVVALREIGARPDTKKLMELAKRNPDLTDIAVEYIASTENKAAFTAIGAMYDDAATAQRATILTALAKSRHYGRSSDSYWKPFLTNVAAEKDPDLRLRLAAVLERRSNTLAEGFIARLLADEDARVRGAAGGLVLRAVAEAQTSNTQTTFAEPSFGPPSKERSKGTPFNVLKAVKLKAKHDSWHSLMANTLDETPDIRFHLAYYVTGDGRTDLPVLDAALARENLRDELKHVGDDKAVGLILARLPWPDARDRVAEWGRDPFLYARMLGQTKHAPAPLRTLLLEPALLDAAMETAKDTELALIAYALLREPDDSPVSLYATNEENARTLERLRKAGHPLARAMALYVKATQREVVGTALFNEALADEEPWVRYWAVAGIVARIKDLSERGHTLASLLSDTDTTVASAAAIGLLSSDLRNAAGYRYSFRMFRYRELDVYIYSRTFDEYDYSSRASRSLRPLDGRPDFLDDVRKRLEDLLEAEGAGGVGPFAVLLAQYGDYTGMDLLLERWQRTQDTAAQGFLLVGLALARDERFLPPLKAKVASTDGSYELRELLNWLRGVRGEEARKLRREINRRLRASD